MAKPEDATPPPAAGLSQSAAAALWQFPTTRARVIERAQATRALGLRYKLGAGEIIRATSKLRKGTHLDCSEWACYILGISKLTKDPLFIRFNGGWINSNALVFDGTHTGGLFTQTTMPQPGDLMAVGGSRGTVGHVVIVLTVRDGRAETVIECSSYHDRRTGNAIGIRTAAFMYARGAIVLRPDWL